MHKPLEGIRVLEWGVFHAGPGGTAILCDLGAEVIKIEQPVVGDPVRQLLRYKNVNFSLPGERTLLYEGSNRGKLGITLDLSLPEGREIALNLVGKCDIFLTNLRRDTITKMKMDYKTLSQVNPRLIYASVSSYGNRGPDGDGGGFDHQGQGRSGMMFNNGEPGMSPSIVQWGVIDQATAIMSSYQMVLALLMRERFGIGQEVAVSLLGTASYLLFLNNLAALLTGQEISRHEQASADPLRNFYQCQDGKWIVHNQPPGEENWRAVCELLGHHELSDDLRYNDRDKRLDNSKELVAIFSKAFASKPRDVWLKLFKDKKLVMCSVNTTLEAVNDPQLAANGYIVDSEHPDLGHIRIPGFPIQFSNAEVNHNLLAPKLGEHTERVLRDIGGYSDEDIARFKKRKAI